MGELHSINGGLTAKQHRAIAALISEPTIAAAARAASVGEATIYRWLSERHFADTYRSARREAVNQAVANLQRSSSDAAAVLASIMNDASEKGATRLAAAKTVLEMAIKAVEMEDLTRRIEALEAAQGARK
jgi:DNA-binding MurR/RpiR family transcriptional regulator